MSLIITELFLSSSIVRSIKLHSARFRSREMVRVDTNAKAVAKLSN